MNPYPLENLRQKGFYLARITGPDDKYTVGRDFLQGRAHGIAWEYTPDDIGQLPAWILRAGGICSGCGRADPKHVELIAAFPHGWQSAGIGFSSRDLLAIWGQGPPDGTEEQIADALDDRVPVFASEKEIPF